MITVNIDGMADFSNLLLYFDRSVFNNFVNATILDELTTIMYRIKQDEGIPKEYKDSLVLWSSVEEGKVYLTAYVPSKMKWKKFGRHMVSERYRCPIHKYFGGELTPEYTGPDYIKQKFEEDKPRIINNIKSKILSYLRDI